MFSAKAPAGAAFIRQCLMKIQQEGAAPKEHTGELVIEGGYNTVAFARMKFPFGIFFPVAISTNNILNPQWKTMRAYRKEQSKNKIFSKNSDALIHHKQNPYNIFSSRSLAPQASNGAQEQIRTFQQVQGLLIERGVSPQFFLNYIYYDDQGTRIAPRAELDLCDLCVSTKFPRLSEKDLQKIAAGLVLGINELHKKNLVHRDLSTCNVLLVSFAGKDVLIADLDTVIPVDPVTGCAKGDDKIVGAVEPPEFNGLYERDHAGDYWKKGVEEQYQKINLKAADCFMAGFVLAELCKILASFASDKLRSLVDGLLEDKPDKRLTIEKALEHPFFGDTAVQRADFFASLLNSRKDWWMNGYLARCLQKNDGFLLLRQEVQPVYALAQDIQSQLLFFEAADHSISSEFIQECLRAFNAKVVSFNEECTNAIKAISDNPKLTTSLKNLQEAINNSGKIINAKFISSFQISRCRKR